MRREVVRAVVRTVSHCSRSSRYSLQMNPLCGSSNSGGGGGSIIHRHRINV